LRTTRALMQEINKAQVKAAKANGWLVIESKAGRIFTIPGEAIKCNTAFVEFIDDDDWHIVLPYDQIASMEVGSVVMGAKPYRTGRRRSQPSAE
jgi:hypothetical protein